MPWLIFNKANHDRIVALNAGTKFKIIPRPIQVAGALTLGYSAAPDLVKTNPEYINYWTQHLTGIPSVDMLPAALFLLDLTV